MVSVKNGKDVHARVKEQPFVIQAALGAGNVPQPGIINGLVQVGIIIDQKFHHNQGYGFHIGAVAELAKAWNGRRPQCGGQRAAGWFHGEGSFTGSKNL
ncbi:hypothetical protein D3C75_1107640 [compost metagenome]